MNLSLRRFRVLARLLWLFSLSVLTSALVLIWVCSYWRILSWDFSTVAKRYGFVCAIKGYVVASYCESDVPPSLGSKISSRDVTAYEAIRDSTSYQELYTDWHLQEMGLTGNNEKEQLVLQEIERTQQLIFGAKLKMRESIRNLLCRCLQDRMFFVIIDRKVSLESIVRFPLWLPVILAGFYPMFVFCKRIRHSKIKSTACNRCMYNLTSNISGTCPECGTLIPEEQRKKLQGLSPNQL